MRPEARECPSLGRVVWAWMSASSFIDQVPGCIGVEPDSFAPTQIQLPFRDADTRRKDAPPGRHPDRPARGLPTPWQRPHLERAAAEPCQISAHFAAADADNASSASRESG